MSKNEQQRLYKIASEHSETLKERGDLERHWSDSEDFIEIAVWNLEKMLKKAYELGKATKTN